FIKHHGHGGPLELPKADTDSMRLLGSGADCSIAYGDGIIQMHQQKQTATVEELVDYASLGNPDLILVEGFKKRLLKKLFCCVQLKIAWSFKSCKISSWQLHRKNCSWTI